MSRIEKFTSKLGGNIRESMGGSTAGAVGPLPTQPSGPSQYQGIARPKEALTIPLDRIIPDPDQPRKEFEDGPLDDLAASLKARGQLQPVRVRWSQEAERWVIIAGERRYRAAIRAGIASLLCVEAKGAMTAGEILEDQLVENCVREDLKPIEQARAFKSLVELRGCSYRQLAETLNISHMAVSRAMSLLDLPAEVQDRVTAGELAASVAVEVARLEDPEEQREVAARVVSEGLNRAEAVEVVRQVSQGKPKLSGKGRGATAKPKAKSGAPMQKAWNFKAADGRKVVVMGRRVLSRAEALDVLKEVVGRLESEIETAGDQAAA